MTAASQLSRASVAPSLSLVTRQKLVPEPQVGQVPWSTTRIQAFLPVEIHGAMCPLSETWSEPASGPLFMSTPFVSLGLGT